MTADSDCLLCGCRLYARTWAVPDGVPNFERRAWKHGPDQRGRVSIY